MPCYACSREIGRRKHPTVQPDYSGYIRLPVEPDDITVADVLVAVFT